MRREPLAEASVLALTVAWGLTFVVVPRALEDCGTVTLTALRMAVGTAATLVLLRPRLRAASPRVWRYGLLGGVLLGAAYLLQTFGLRTAESGESGFLTAFYVPLVPAIDAAVHLRRPRARDLVGVLLATAGIACIVVDPNAPSSSGALAIGPGPALVALAAIFWAAQIVAIGRVAPDADPAVLATIQLAVAAAVSAAALPFADERPVVWSADLAASVFFLGYVACGLGFAIQAWAQQRLPPTRAAILFSPEPVFAALAGWWFRDETFGARQWAGALLVAFAVALALGLLSRRGAEPADAAAS